MQTLNQFLIDHMASLTWLDWVDSLILFCMAGYAIYRMESKINPLHWQIHELIEANGEQQGRIELQFDELYELRQKVRDLEYQHREVTEMFSERNRYRDN